MVLSDAGVGAAFTGDSAGDPDLLSDAGVGRAFTGDPDSELLDAGVGTALLTALAGLLVFAADGAGAPALAITGCPFTGGGACCRGAGCGCFAPAALAGGHGGGGMLPLCLAGGGWGTPAFTAKALPRDKMLARASGSVAAMTHLAALPFTMTWQGFRVSRGRVAARTRTFPGNASFLARDPHPADAHDAWRVVGPERRGLGPPRGDGACGRHVEMEDSWYYGSHSDLYGSRSDLYGSRSCFYGSWWPLFWGLHRSPRKARDTRQGRPEPNPARKAVPNPTPHDFCHTCFSDPQ